VAVAAAPMVTTPVIEQKEEVAVEELPTSLPLDDIPAELAEIFDSGLNGDLGDKLSMSPINDMTKSMGINEKIFTITELFGGDNDIFNTIVRRINELDTYQEAKAYLATSALLIHHKKLDRWFQPGGHIEDHDTSLLSASMREAKEECGIQDPKVWSPEIFDIDVHTIPKRKEVPEHLHYDIRFCFIATNNEYKADLTEVKGIKWVTLSECILQADKMGSVSRMALKIQ